MFFIPPSEAILTNLNQYLIIWLFWFSCWTEHQALLILHLSVIQPCLHSYCNSLKLLQVLTVQSWTFSESFLRLTHRCRCLFYLDSLSRTLRLEQATIEELLSFISSSLQLAQIIHSLVSLRSFEVLFQQSSFCALVFLLFVISCFCEYFNLFLSWICLEKIFQLHRFQIQRIQASKLVGRICFSSIIFSINKWWFCVFVFSCLSWIDCMRYNQAIFQQDSTIQDFSVCSFCLCCLSQLTANFPFCLCS